MRFLRLPDAISVVCCKLLLQIASCKLAFRSNVHSSWTLGVIKLMNEKSRGGQVPIL